jgi:hypothetical protein
VIRPRAWLKLDCRLRAEECLTAAMIDGAATHHDTHSTFWRRWAVFDCSLNAACMVVAYLLDSLLSGRNWSDALDSTTA